MTKKSKITKKELAAVLRESVAAINKPGPLRVIVDVGDTRYYVQRATELLALVLESPTPQQQEAYLGDAIFLLGVAKHMTRCFAATLQAEPRRVKSTEIGGTFTLQHSNYETEPIPYHASASQIEIALEKAREASEDKERHMV